MGDINPRRMERQMLYRLAKDDNSYAQGGCPALYGDTDDIAQMTAQGKFLPEEKVAQLLDLLPDETAVAIPTETVFRGVAKFAAEHGDAELASRLEAFLQRMGL